MKTPENPRIQVQDIEGTSFAIQFDHFDVTGEDWIRTFKLILKFLTFGDKTIKELFSEELEENGGNEDSR